MISLIDTKQTTKSRTLWFELLLTKIDEYSGIKNTEDLKLESLAIRALPSKQPSFEAAQGRIEKWVDELRGKKQESLILQDKDSQMAEQIEKARQAEASAQRAQRDIEVQKDRNLAGMGSRPAAKESQEPYTAYVDHGGFGILDFFFGPKEVTRYRTVRDDSAGEAWDQRRAQIQNAFAERNDSLKKELAAARRRKDNIAAMKDANLAKLESIEDKIYRLECVIKLEREKLEQEKKLAAQEYMNLCRVSLQQQVQAYLSGESGVLARTEVAMRAGADETEQVFVELAMERFTQALQQKLRWIDQMRQEKCPEILRQVENLSEISQKLQRILIEMEAG